MVTIGRAISEQPTVFLGDPWSHPLLLTWRLLRLALNGTAFLTVILLYSATCINVCALAATTLVLLFLRNSLNETLLPSTVGRNSGPFPWASVARYLVYRTGTFRYLFIANGTFGALLVAFLTANLPSCAFVVVRLALGVPSPVAAYTLGIFLVHGFLGCVLLHWAIARCTKSLGTPVKRLFSLMAATGHRVGNFRVRLMVNLAIARLNDKFGFSYGAFGCVTLGSFAKCMLLFGELVSYSYQLIRGI